MKKSRKALIIIGGKGPTSFPYDIKEYYTVIAADSGFDLAKELDIVPDIIIGDLDSTKYREELINSGIIPESREKDYSDTELALNIIKGSDYDLIGGGEGQFDHILALLNSFRKFNSPEFWFTREDIIIKVSKEVIIKSKEEITLSILPLEKIAKVDSSGLFWELKDFEISNKNLSLSNKTKANLSSIRTDNPIFLRISIKYLEQIKEMVILN